MSELYVEARTQHDAEQLEHRQAQTHSAQNDQVVLRRLQELVDATLRQIFISYRIQLTKLYIL